MNNINLTLVSNFTANQQNPNVAYSNSWIQQDGAPFPLFAQASYITNLDALKISLSSTGLSIGNVGIFDPISGAVADVVNVGVGANALRVLTQNFGSNVDSVAIGDSSGNLVGTTRGGLNVYQVNANSAIDIAQCNVTLPVSGSVTVLNPVNSLSAYITNPQIEITNDAGNPIPVTGSLSATILNSVTSVSIANNNVNSPLYFQYSSNLQLDPAGKLRVAQPAASWWHQSTVDKDGDFRLTEQFTGLSAQSIFIQDLGSTLLTSGLSSTGYVIRQSKRHFKFTPGIGTQVYGTLNFCGSDPYTVKRFGQFNYASGIFFELSANNSFNVVVRRREMDGTIVEDRTNSANFNGDKLDGTGSSGLNFFTSVSATGLTYSSISTVAFPNQTLSAYDVTYSTSSSLIGVFNQSSTVTVSGINPSGYDGVAWVSSITPSTITLTYPFNPGSFVSGNTITLTQTPFHEEWTWWFDYFGGRTSRVRFVLVGPTGSFIIHTYGVAGRYGQQFVSETALPVRTEIFNQATLSYLPYVLASSKAIDTEAEVTMNPFFANYNTVSQVVWPSTTSTAEYAIIGLGLRQGEPYNKVDIQLQGLSITDLGWQNVNAGSGNSTPANYSWRLMYNPVLSGQNTSAKQSISGSINMGKASRVWDYNTGVVYLSGGYQILGGWGSATTVQDIQTALNFLNIGANVDYTQPDSVVLLVQQNNYSLNPPYKPLVCAATLNWQEQF